MKSTNFPLNLCHTADLLQDEHHLDTCMYVYSIFCACIYENFLTFFTFPVVICIGLSTSQYLAIECNTIRVDNFQCDKSITVIDYLNTCVCKQITMEMLKPVYLKKNLSFRIATITESQTLSCQLQPHCAHPISSVCKKTVSSGDCM